MGTAVGIVLDIVVFLAAIVGLTVWFIVLSPLYLFRVIVILLAKCLKSKAFGDILTPLDLFFYAVLEPEFNTAPEAVPCATLCLEGHLDFDDFKVRIEDTLLGVQENGRSLNYGRLQQHVQVWMGFPFFEWDKNFDISKHVHLIPNQSVTESTKCSVIMNLARKPFLPGSSPWEILVLPYIQKGCPKTLIAMRFHHLIGDGRSLLKILTRTSGQGESKKLAVKTSQEENDVSIAEKFKRFYQFSIAIPRVFFKGTGKMSKPPGIFHNLPTVTREQILVAETDKIPLELFKSLKRDVGAPFTAVLATALSKSIRYLNIKGLKGQKPEHTNEILEFHGFQPIPRQNHPEGKLVNHFYLTTLGMVSGNDSTAAERLKRNTENFYKTRVSNLQFAVGQNIFVNIVCSLPVFICKRLRPKNRLAFLISNMPGPEETVSFCNYPVSELLFWAPDGRNNGVAFSVMSYNGFVRIGVCIDKYLAGSQNTLDEMVQIIQNELNEMFALVQV